MSSGTPDLVQVVGSKLRLNQHAGQQRAWRSTRRFTFVIAGTQSGKTSWGPWWLRDRIAKFGDGDYLAVTATYDLFKLKMLPEMLRVFTEYCASDGWRWSPSERVIANAKSRIILRSAEADGGLESATARAAWLDECGQDRFSLQAWEAVQRRLSLSQGPVIGTTTPYNLGWLKQQVFDRWRAGDKDYNVIQFKSTMNPRFPVEEYERAKRTLPSWKFRMFYDGEFTRPAGMIYEDFSDTENICQPFSVPFHWPRYVGIDFGAVNTALVWLAHDPDADIYYLYDCTLDGGKTTRQHADAALAKSSAYIGASIVWTGGAKSETQQRMDWNDCGVPVDEPAIWDVEGGIDRVIELIKSRRLRVFADQAGLLDEIGRYSRVLDDGGQPTELIADKATFHRLDALRYAVVGANSGTDTGLVYTANPLAGYRG